MQFQIIHFRKIYYFFFFKCSISFLQMPISINFWPKTVTLLYKTHFYINFHFSDLLAAASIISAAISFRRWSRWSANISSGQCSSRIKLCRASSFHSMSSDVAQPFLTISKQISHIKLILNISYKVGTLLMYFCLPDTNVCSQMGSKQQIVHFISCSTLTTCNNVLIFLCLSLGRVYCNCIFVIYTLSSKIIKFIKLTPEVPSARVQTLCEWTERWRTPLSQHSGPPEARTPCVNVDGTSLLTNSLYP